MRSNTTRIGPCAHRAHRGSSSPRSSASCRFPARRQAFRSTRSWRLLSARCRHRHGRTSRMYLTSRVRTWATRTGWVRFTRPICWARTRPRPRCGSSSSSPPKEASPSLYSVPIPPTPRTHQTEFRRTRSSTLCSRSSSGRPARRARGLYALEGETRTEAQQHDAGHALHPLSHSWRRDEIANACNQHAVYDHPGPADDGKYQAELEQPRQDGLTRRHELRQKSHEEHAELRV